eukprot:1144052-Pelagomonas_calceolata.AAC.4
MCILKLLPKEEGAHSSSCIGHHHTLGNSKICSIYRPQGNNRRGVARGFPQSKCKVACSMVHAHIRLLLCRIRPVECLNA